MHKTASLTNTSFWQIILRGLCSRCPNCGDGALFSRYLKPVEKCSSCEEPLGHIRADDGPAWLTIVLVSHIIGSVLLAVLPGNDWPTWLVFALVTIPAVALMLLILPRAKGLFIAWIWRSGCGTAK
jgi:uncharacterized protein (DUF983 family)